MPDFGPDSLKLDASKEIERIGERIRSYLASHHRRGLVVAISGGIDSSVVAALCVHALGKNRVLGLLLPERESSEETTRLGKLVVTSLGIEHIEENITSTLKAVGCYSRRDQAIRCVFPELDDKCTVKIVLPGLLETESLRVFSVVIHTATGQVVRKRLPPESYLGVVAASNFKQRIRAMFCYYHADRMNYMVAGTPNRLEYDQGFFVKQGDGAADIKPIAHLYKSQVYQLARTFDIPEEIQSRPPTTDTYSMPQSQEEFFFSLPHVKMDLCLYGKNNGISRKEVAAATELNEDQVQRVFDDIDQKRKTTNFLHRPPELIVPVLEVDRIGLG